MVQSHARVHVWGDADVDGRAAHVWGISGAVADQQGAPIPGVTITISGLNLMGIRSAS